MMEDADNHGKVIFLYFFLFFAFVTCVNGIFIYQALYTHAGEVTENAYEKGLAYNVTLKTSKDQPALREKAEMENGSFRWTINMADGSPLTRAITKVSFFRPVKGGNDFTVELQEVSPGIYEAIPQFPEKGLWTAHMDVKWKEQQYRTSQDIIIR